MVGIKVLLIDNSQIYREGLAKLLQGASNIEVVDACPYKLEAVESACKHQPNVVLTDIVSPEGSGTDIVERIHQKLPKTRIVILTHSETDEDVIATTAVGATGYISKNTSLENLIKTIILANEGKFIVSPPMSARLLAILGLLTEWQIAGTLESNALLSKRQKEVLSLVSRGLTNGQIATTLFISKHTVKVHLQNIMQKLNARTRQQAVVLARRSGFIETALTSRSD